MPTRNVATDLAEAELVEHYRTTSDGRWFEELYRGSRRKVFAVCVRILGDADRAEDACHDAYLRAYERFDTLRGTNFSAWVCRIAANRAYDDLRLRAKESADELADEEIPTEEPGSRVEQEAISREGLERALEIVRSLEPHQRRVFLLRQLDHKTYHEIELDTGYSPKEVKTYLQNARRNFQIRWAAQSDAALGNFHG